MGTDAARIEDEAKLLYVAMTRATENLLMTSSKASPFSVKLAEMVERYKRGIAA